MLIIISFNCVWMEIECSSTIVPFMGLSKQGVLNELNLRIKMKKL